MVMFQLMNAKWEWQRWFLHWWIDLFVDWLIDWWFSLFNSNEIESSPENGIIHRRYLHKLASRSSLRDLAGCDDINLNISTLETIKTLSFLMNFDLVTNFFDNFWPYKLKFWWILTLLSTFNEFWLEKPQNHWNVDTFWPKKIIISTSETPKRLKFGLILTLNQFFD